MPIPEHLLNKTCTVKRKETDSDSYSDTGSLKKTDNTITVYSDVKIRINKNDPKNEDNLNEVGLINSTHLGFTKVGYDFKYGDIFVDDSNNKEYICIFVNEEPGGVEDHHMEVYLNNQ